MIDIIISVFEFCLGVAFGVFVYDLTHSEKFRAWVKRTWYWRCVKLPYPMSHEATVSWMVGKGTVKPQSIRLGEQDHEVVYMDKEKCLIYLKRKGKVVSHGENE